MNINKLILPFFITTILALLYFFYFSPQNELGLFSDFDTNSNINKEVIVKILHDKGFVQDPAGGGTIFYVEDGAGKQVKVSEPLILPPGMDVTQRVTLRGHYNGNYFHAHEVRLRN
jgi:hypothetical protein